jgi:Rrf2 family protein
VKFSTKVRYGLRVLAELAVTDNSEPVMASVLAEKQDISIKYLERIMNSLKKAEIVESVRGCHGGYRMIKKPEEISVYDIYMAVEGDIHVTPCCSNSHCEKEGNCAATRFWNKVNSDIIELTKDYNVAQILER